jgi:hypothetical protein
MIFSAWRPPFTSRGEKPHLVEKYKFLNPLSIDESYGDGTYVVR